MADLQYRFGGPIPEGAQRLKDRRVARENTQAQRRRTAPPIGVDVLGMPIFPEHRENREELFLVLEGGRSVRGTCHAADDLGPELIDGRRGRGFTPSALAAVR